MRGTSETQSTIYGPVDSWRFGFSLGVDLILRTSVCSFNCVYCQLGSIQEITNERQLFVKTEKVMSDLKKSDWQKSDIITFSGSGEPTLARNLGETLKKIKEYTNIETHVLTNGTLLENKAVRSELCNADRVSVKLDAVDEKMFATVNRPFNGITLQSILSGTKIFRKEFSGFFDTQIMFLPSNRKMTAQLCDLINEIKPDEVQLNTPKRAYPSSWFIESRGRYDYKKSKVKLHDLKVIEREEAIEIENQIRKKTGLVVSSVYGES
jgi:wyosine [tRNA(Phe)-imidazoG37] synthetase (radical SAM superfamily)